MRVATVDGLVTLFYDGSKQLFNEELHGEFWGEYYDHDCNEDEIDNWEEWDLSVECKKYWRERLSWQQIIIADGVTEISKWTFAVCYNVKRVIFANTVIRIGECALLRCRSLVYIKLPTHLEYIGTSSFCLCNLLSVFIPPSCRVIRNDAFGYNEYLYILNVPQHTALGGNVIDGTVLAKASPFEVNTSGWYHSEVNDDMNTWIKNLNHGEAFALHRACSSFQPLKQVLFTIIQKKGLRAFKVKNSAGITPSQYLNENPYTEFTEKEIIHDYIMKMMGEYE
ncbi:leucine-rich repeat domain-containing protein [Chaetoceros tenuissimus]|uniref:Leucine-rich repeat domain-containing protein n=1 Tax=Chaetoceros tenuissimus TaxID=426638 RepID=A0AAD3DEM5_9STRA|nr:leucine-rich repeat domain-containing protein [Chaetoceros tenuissimus]